MELREQMRRINSDLSRTMDLYRVWARKCGLNYNTLLVLYVLDDLEVCTQKQICEWWALPKQTVHGILLELEKKGYLETGVNAENRRERLIRFSADGRRYARSVLGPLHQMEENAMRRMGPAGCRELQESAAAYWRALWEELENGESAGKEV